MQACRRAWQLAYRQRLGASIHVTFDQTRCTQRGFLGIHTLASRKSMKLARPLEACFLKSARPLNLQYICAKAKPRAPLTQVLPPHRCQNGDAIERRRRSGRNGATVRNAKEEIEQGKTRWLSRNRPSVPHLGDAREAREATSCMSVGYLGLSSRRVGCTGLRCRGAEVLRFVVRSWG